MRKVSFNVIVAIENVQQKYFAQIGGYVIVIYIEECSRNAEFVLENAKQFIYNLFLLFFFFEDSCRHHPGTPFFHDAYKGWSCCNKKSVDFTEFLNIKGCQLSKHSNVKPVEPEKPAPKVIEEEPEPPKIREPMKPSSLERPSFDMELVTLKPIVAPALKQSIDNLVVNETKKQPTNSPKYESFFAINGMIQWKLSNDIVIDKCLFVIFSEITVGTTCKNGGCGQTYESPASDNTECVYHPGVPIFHEGLKFWSCCTKRTTDFTAFMNQKGCAYGQHKWIANVSTQIVSKLLIIFDLLK